MKCPNCGEELTKSQSISEVWECTKCGMKIKPINECNEEENSEINPPPLDDKTTNSPNTHEKTNVHSKKNNKQLLIIGITAIVIVIIIIIIIVFGNDNNFNKLYSDIADEDWCTISDDGSYMKIDTNPYDIEDYFDADAYNKVKTINEDLGFSGAVLEKMEETTSLDGRQTEQSDKVSVSWKYHPDNGLEVTYEWN